MAAITASGAIIAAVLNGALSPAGQPQPPAPGVAPSASTAPSRTPAASSPSSSGPLIVGDNSAFIADVTYPDKSKVTTGSHFIKKWKIKDIGSVRWSGRYLAPSGPSTGRCTYPPRVPVPTADPGQDVIISVRVTAPASPGLCFVTWKMVSASGAFYFPNEIGIWFDVNIVSGAPRRAA